MEYKRERARCKEVVCGQWSTWSNNAWVKYGKSSQSRRYELSAQWWWHDSVALSLNTVLIILCWKFANLWPRASGLTSIMIIIIMWTFVQRDLNKIPQVRSWLKQISLLKQINMTDIPCVVTGALRCFSPTNWSPKRQQTNYIKYTQSLTKHRYPHTVNVCVIYSKTFVTKPLTTNASHTSVTS